MLLFQETVLLLALQLFRRMLLPFYFRTLTFLYVDTFVSCSIVVLRIRFRFCSFREIRFICFFSRVVFLCSIHFSILYMSRSYVVFDFSFIHVCMCSCLCVSQRYFRSTMLSIVRRLEVSVYSFRLHSEYCLVNIRPSLREYFRFVHSIITMCRSYLLLRSFRTFLSLSF